MKAGAWSGRSSCLGTLRLRLASTVRTSRDRRKEQLMATEYVDAGQAVNQASLSGLVGSAPPVVQNVTYQRILEARSEPQNWLTYYGAYDGQRYSPLDQINTENVKRLSPAWVFQAGSVGMHAGPSTYSFEAAPIVVDGVMYVSGWDGWVWALNARTGQELWRYKHAIPYDVSLCCGNVNRGVAVAKGKVFVVTLNAHVLALDAQTGERVWDRTYGDVRAGESATVAPLVVKNLVIVGSSGGEFGVRGHLDAFDLDSGEHVWRCYMIPKPGEPGAETAGPLRQERILLHPGPYERSVGARLPVRGTHRLGRDHARRKGHTEEVSGKGRGAGPLLARARRRQGMDARGLQPQDGAVLRPRAGCRRGDHAETPGVQGEHSVLGCKRHRGRQGHARVRQGLRCVGQRAMALGRQVADLGVGADHGRRSGVRRRTHRGVQRVPRAHRGVVVAVPDRERASQQPIDLQRRRTAVRRRSDGLGFLGRGVRARNARRPAR